MKTDGRTFDTATAWASVRAREAARKAKRVQVRSTWEPDFGVSELAAPPQVFLDGMTGQERKRYLRKQANRKPRIEGPVITPDMIPEGSLLSDVTLARIHAGEMRLTRAPGSAVQPQHREQHRRRRKLERASRKRNRGG